MKFLVNTRDFPPFMISGISYHLRNLYANITGQI